MEGLKASVQLTQATRRCNFNRWIVCTQPQDDAYRRCLKAFLDSLYAAKLYSIFDRRSRSETAEVADTAATLVAIVTRDLAALLLPGSPAAVCSSVTTQRSPASPGRQTSVRFHTGRTVIG